MRISCPVCSTSYEVPDPMLPGGRKVRCAKCGHQWVPRPAAPHAPPPARRPIVEAAAETPPRGRSGEAPASTPPLPPTGPLSPDAHRATIQIDPDEAPMQPPPRQRTSTGVWVGWAASVGIWALVLWAAYAYRAQVMDAWPPSQRLYAALGLGPGS